MAVLCSEGKFASHIASKGLAMCSSLEMFRNKYSFEIVFSETTLALDLKNNRLKHDWRNLISEVLT